MEMITLTIEKLVHGGQGMAHSGDATVFVWNALPGEEVRARIMKKKGHVWEAVAEEILTPSEHRVHPCESFFLSTSAWDIMTAAHEADQKVAIARDTYSRLGDITLPETALFVDSSIQYGYRNKIEWSFAQGSDGMPAIGFHARGSWSVIPSPEGTVLAHQNMNALAQHIQAWMRAEGIPLRSAKALLIRSSAHGECIAGLFIKDRISVQTLPDHLPFFAGFQLWYSTHKSPASVPTELLRACGADTLTDTVNGRAFTYGLFSFFQVNIPLYEKVITATEQYIAAQEVRDVTELYAGVGSIGLSLSSVVTSAVLVEIAPESAVFAQKNIDTLGLGSVYTSCCVPAEKALEHILSDRGLIVDPPRAGLHKDVIERICAVRPPWIVYMSCDIATHARDMKLLSAYYRAEHHSLYNFFPRTPHIEALAFLTRI
jgi:23S rRNA (uracil1939-C5)-methyltransferase